MVCYVHICIYLKTISCILYIIYIDDGHTLKHPTLPQIVVNIPAGTRPLLEGHRGVATQPTSLWSSYCYLKQRAFAERNHRILPYHNAVFFRSMASPKQFWNLYLGSGGVVNDESPISEFKMIFKDCQFLLTMKWGPQHHPHFWIWVGFTTASRVNYNVDTNDCMVLTCHVPFKKKSSLPTIVFQGLC